MFTSFKDNFKKDRKENIEIPDEVIETLNNNLPKQFTYKEIGEGMCAVMPVNSNELNFKMGIKFPEIPKEIQKEIKNFDDMYEYLYRTQKSCEIETDSEGNITINNQKIPLENLVIDVLEHNKVGKWSMIPLSFPEPVKINIKAGNITREFTLARQPYESMDITYLKSVEEKPLGIQMFIKEKENRKNVSIDIKINMSIDELKSVEEIVEVCDFYKNFLTGKIMLGTSEIKSLKNVEYTNNVHIDEKVSFWNKVLELEKILDKNFDATKLKPEDYNKVQRMYKSLVEKKPFKIPNKVNAMKLDNMESYEKALELVGETMAFEFTREENIKIMNRKIKIYILERVYNYTIKDVVLENEIVRVFLEEIEDKSFVTQKYFLSEKNISEELGKFGEDYEENRSAEVL